MERLLKLLSCWNSWWNKSNFQRKGRRGGKYDSTNKEKEKKDLLNLKYKKTLSVTNKEHVKTNEKDDIHVSNQLHEEFP